MSRYDDVIAALNHRQPDCLPVDFGATAVTGMHVSCVAALRDYLGLPRRPVKVHEPFQMLGWIDDDLADAMGLSFTCPMPRGTIFGFTNENWRPWRTPWGQEVLVPGAFLTTPADDGGLLIYPQGDRSVPPAGHMPGGGYFFDAIIRQQPIDEDKLNPEDNCEEFTLWDASQLQQFAADCQKARASAGGRAVIAGLPGAALGDIALVPGNGLKAPKGIRDVAEWYMSTAVRQDYVHAVFRRQTDIALRNMKQINAACGNCIDVVFLCGTDFGTQAGLFCSIDAYKELWSPYYREMTSWIHANTNWKIFKHSCGAVEKLIPHFIESGFDILNPVQCSAAGMEPEVLKQKYGQQITFWGGGVDTQHTLPFGTPEQVKLQVLERCRTFAPGGGFVFNAIHNVQARTPIANIAAMLDAIREYRLR